MHGVINVVDFPTVEFYSMLFCTLSWFKEMNHFPYGHVKDNLGAVDRHLLSALFGTNKSAVKQ